MSSNFTDGLQAMGVPLFGGTHGLVAYRNVYFADFTYGDDANSGLGYGAGNAKASVQACLDLVRDSDVIVVVPSATYNEQLTTGLVVGRPSVVKDSPPGQGRYVTLMGASNTQWAFDSPQLYNVDGDTATLTIRSPGFRISGFRIIGDDGSPVGVKALIAGSSATAESNWAAGFQIDNNVFYGAVSASAGIAMQASMNWRIIGNQFDHFASTNTGAIVAAAGGFSTFPRGHVLGNIFTNCKDNIVIGFGSTVISGNILADNHVNALTRGIVLTGGTSNTVTFNHLGGTTYDGTQYVAAAGDNWAGNVTEHDGATAILADTPWTTNVPG